MQGWRLEKWYILQTKLAYCQCFCLWVCKVAWLAWLTLFLSELSCPDVMVMMFSPGVKMSSALNQPRHIGHCCSGNRSAPAASLVSMRTSAPRFWLGSHRPVMRTQRWYTTSPSCTLSRANIFSVFNGAKSVMICDVPKTTNDRCSV